MRKRYKIILNVEITDPEERFPAGGDYTHMTRIEGIVYAVSRTWVGDDVQITLDKVVDKGEVKREITDKDRSES